MPASLFDSQVSPDWEAFRDCILGHSIPKRVHYIELFLDGEVKPVIARRFGLWGGIPADAPDAAWHREIAIQRFLGYDYVRCGLDALPMPLNRATAADTATLERTAGRSFVDEHRGPITTWDEFHAYPWPDPAAATTRALEWYQKNLPDDMCIVGSGGFAHFAELVCWLMGYETLCYALYDQRDLVTAIAERLQEIYRTVLRRILEFDRVKIIWGSDDMGHRSGTLISPDDLREFVLPGHRQMAAMSHAAGRPYLLHACGRLDAIMPDLIDDIRIDAKHSFEDTIEDCIDFHAQYGNRIATLGGIDVDFLCRRDETAVRERVRRTLAACHAKGRYCLGTGNSVANYIPVDNYLAMLDEGRRFPG